MLAPKECLLHVLVHEHVTNEHVPCRCPVTSLPAKDPDFSVRCFFLLRFFILCG